MENLIVFNDVEAEEKICEIRDTCAERDRIIEACWARIESYKRIIQTEADKAAQKIAWLENGLQCYFNSVEHQSTKTQETYRLPTGKLKMKYAFERMVPDEEALIASYPAFVEHKPSLKWGELKKQLAIVDSKVVDTETGEIVQGVTLDAVPSKFIVEVE